MSSTLTSSIQYLKGIGPKRAQLLQKIGIKSVEDVLYYFPRRYEDRSHFSPIAKLALGSVATIKAEVLTTHGRRSFKSGLNLFEAVVGDDTGRLFAVWFNQPYLKNYLKNGTHVILYGKVELYKDRMQMPSPEFEIIEDVDESLDVNRIVPIYSLPGGFSQRVFRKMVNAILDKYLPQVSEVLPFDIRSRHNLLNLPKSLHNIHFPENQDLRSSAYQRLSFEEFFIYQMPLILRKLKRKEKRGIAFTVDEELLNRFIHSLPFTLTDSQRLVISEIKADMSSSRPMQRLLQGDVGCGKTIVATLAALVAVGNGFQVAFMAPTEILANQHFEKLQQFFEALGHKVTKSQSHKEKIKIGLLTSSLSEKEKKELYRQIRTDDVDIIVGTHALIQEGVRFKNLGLIVIDEQHKFGVSQRALLPQKGINPDVLIMTATPIPRTLSMTLYGDLDISIIRELPQGRKKIQTLLYGFDRKSDAYDFVKEQIRQSRQAYIVYPLIEENPKLALNSAKSMYKEFSQNIFKDFKVGLIHGRLKREEQERVMRQFRNGDLQILVATTVLEVGIDVPNVTVLLIEHAERFGLSQLHQIRGRIGRGAHESYCFLLAEPQTEEAQARLKVLVESCDGFRIAEEDLKIRGPGEFFGERQHGLTELKIANPLTQMHLLKATREEVVRLINDDPRLEKRQNQELKAQLYKRFPEFEKFMMVG